MSDHLLQFFLSSEEVRLDEAKDGETPLVWKVVLRTGVWKLRPGPGGVKLKEPLKVYRDKAPKGHISLASLKKNFDAAAKENVTTVAVHADGTTADNGFVRKLAIQDVSGEDGSAAKESLLWAGMEITEPDVKGKIERKTLVGVSGGILFDYERTEDAKKFDQILSHVMITNSPWINGTGGFTDKLPEGVLAADEPSDLPFGELEFGDDLDIVAAPEPPGVELQGVLDNEPKPGALVWKPSDGFSWIKGKLQRALDDYRRAVMASMGEEAYKLDYPYFSIDDVQGDSSGGKALVCSGYGAERESWVALFTIEDTDGHDQAVITPFAKWTPVRQEYVAAAEVDELSASAAGRSRASDPGHAPSQEPGSALRVAQQKRAERLGLSRRTRQTTGGTMGKISDLLKGVELSDEQNDAIRQEEEEQDRKDQLLADMATNDRKAKVDVYLAKLDELKIDDPGIKAYVRNVMLSDDGEPALMLSEETDSGGRTQPVARTATEVLQGFIDALPKAKEGHVSLADQARKLPDDPKPDETNDGGEPKTVAEIMAAADAQAAELAEFGLEGATLSENGAK